MTVPSPVDERLEGMPTFAEALRVWGKIGLLSFGGPAGQIALMHRVMVEEKRWIEDRQFLPALNFCMLLPGPEAMQLATYIGWRLHGVRGGLCAGLLFVLPGAAVVLILSAFYALFGQAPAMMALFVGIKAAVLAIVIEALVRVSRRALTGGGDLAISIAAFLCLFALQIPFPVVVLSAALIGFLRNRGESVATGTRAPVQVSHLATLRTVVIWLGVWALPLLAIWAFAGTDHVLTQLAWLFSKLAVVTFGGAYAVLAYMAQEVVEKFGWLSAGEMLDGLGLAETTPGPLILVTEFVGYLAAYRHGGGPALLLGILGASVALWATFAPCFLWIFSGAPYVEQLNANPKLKSALQAVTAAVVGVIANLALWFALHTIFGRITSWDAGPLQIAVPDLSTLNVLALALALLAVAMLFILRRGILLTLAVCGTLALSVSSLMPS